MAFPGEKSRTAGQMALYSILRQANSNMNLAKIKLFGQSQAMIRVKQLYIVKFFKIWNLCSMKRMNIFGTSPVNHEK